MENLKHSKFFEYLDDDQIKLLSSFSKKKHYDKGSILFYEKEQPTSLTLLVEGVLKVYKTDPKNNEIIMHRFLPMSMIAEMAVLEGIPYPASAAFETDGTVIEIDFEKFKKAFFTDPDVALTFFKSLSKKIKHLEDVIALNVVLDSTARLAKYLYEHSDVLNTLKNYQLAEHLHMTPETLSRTFKKLVVLELLVKDSEGYKIKNREGLRVLFE
ncbi:CRP/FNR family transcriptional regulator, anaerobic regulatory protein [Epsilonproteobacteria bacterium SCGC AD-308-P11]|nr:CRP/FNR family transcriptional regulator, anaerobic regulatory protein [Epsilonproteobacteria bacterium SCGC AD-308-P11]